MAAEIGAAPSVKPGKPTAVKAKSTRKTQAKLRWAPPTKPGSSKITGYKVEYREGSGAWKVAKANTGKAKPKAKVKKLTSKKSYTFRVSAINAAGTGLPSAPSKAITVR